MDVKVHAIPCTRTLHFCKELNIHVYTYMHMYFVCQ